MPIPDSRNKLIDLITSSFIGLREELDGAEPDLANLPCIDEGFAGGSRLVDRARRGLH